MYSATKYLNQGRYLSQTQAEGFFHERSIESNNRLSPWNVAISLVSAINIMVGSHGGMGDGTGNA